MVQASTLLVAAAFVVAPVLAAPAGPHHHRHIAADHAPAEPSVTRSIDDFDSLDIEAREPNPKFSFGKVFRGISNVVKKVAPVALKAGSLLLRRDEEGNIYVRELDAEDIALLEARDPKFNLGRTFRRVGGAVSKGLRVANRVVSTAQSLGLRELDDGIYLEEREFDPSDLYFEERDFEDFDELDTREPFKFGQFISRARGAASQARGAASQARGVAGKPLRFGAKVSSTAQSLGLREFDDEAMEVERSIDELD